MTIIIESPESLTAYFNSPASQNRVYAVFDGQSIQSWHTNRKNALAVSSGLPVHVLYKSLEVVR